MSRNATKTVREWVKDREIDGHSTFSYAEIGNALPWYSKSVLNTELTRLVRGGVVTSVHRGFYVTVPVRYKKTGQVPPHYYVDSLFKYLGKPYYMSLLSAAEIAGASHQGVQVDCVTTVLPRLNNSKAKNPLLKWFYRKSIPEDLIYSRNGDGGPIRYSCPEFTALDLIQNEHSLGGLGSVATVLAELVDAIDFARPPSSSLFSAVSGRTVQRTGYILEEVLGEEEKANILYNAYASTSSRMEWIFLSPGSKMAPSGASRKWKVKINADVEVDEL